MGRDGIIVGVRIIKKFVVRPAIICFRSVYNHPFLVGVFLMLLYLYKSFPFLFQLLVSASPVLVCTAVLLGTLLSFGDHNIITLIEEDEEKIHEISELKTGMLESSTVVVKDECSDEGSVYKEFKSVIVERSFEEEPLLDINGINSVNSCHISREIEFEKQSIGEAVQYLNSQTVGMEIDVNLSHESVDDGPLTVANMHSENLEGLKSEEGSANEQTGDHLESFMEDVSRDMFSSTPELVVMADNMKNHITAEKSSSGSWTQFEVLEDELSSVKKIRVDNFEDYISGEGSLDAQIGSPLELSLGSWNHLDSDRDLDNESVSGSDGAESSSPDASMADIIPMLDELHPLLEDENPNPSNLSHHSNDESDQQEDEEAGDLKSDGDDDNEEEAQDGKEDTAKSAIKWTEEDEKNLMELGTSELERNQRLESLIARRRARRTVNERNLLDLEGMDLSFPIAPILTTRYNPFDIGHDSYADLGLPPIPGSAPSIMVQRRNPFDLPYDSSEEKPDLTGDSFQEEFMELSQRESTNPRMFKRNETFSVGSSIFDFGRQPTRPSRFRPYFVPERTDDMMSYSSFERQYSELSESRMSYSSLQRQSSELSESKASSTALSPKVGDPSDFEEHGSQFSDDVCSLSYEGDDTEDVDDSLPVIEVGQPTDIREDGKGNYAEVDNGLSERELGSDEVQLVGESLEINHSSSSSLSVPKENDGVRDEDHDRGLVDNQVHNLEHVDISDNYCLETSVSDIPTNQSHIEPEFGHEAKADESLPKEPIYDSSPLVIKRNSSHSSNCSDLQRETSEIDLYHVQRDLFGEDESKFHVKDNEDNDLQQQEPNDSRCSMNVVTEVTDSTGPHFKELNPLTSSSLALPVGEYVFASSKDSSTGGVLHGELLKDKILPNEVEQAFTQGDTTEDHHAGMLDSSVADMSFDDGYKSSVDLFFAPQETQFVSSSDSNLSSLEVELKEEGETKIGENEHFLTSSSRMSHHDNDVSEELLFALDESHFLPHDSLIYDPQKQVQPTIHTNLQEFRQVSDVGENAKILKVQEPEDIILTSLLQNDGSFSQLETLEKDSASEIAAQKSIQDKYLEEHDNTTQEDELAEDLLSELDAVGDFSLKSIPLSLDKIYLDGEIHSDVPEETLAEVHCSSGMQFGDSTSNPNVQNYEFGSLTSEPNLAWSKESTSDSHMRDVNAVEFAQAEGMIVNESNLVSSKESVPDLHIEDANIDVLTLEDQSVKENHGTFQKASKEDAQELVDTEFIQDELEMGEVESTKPMSQTTIAIPVIENTLNDKESITVRTEFNLALPEEYILDSSRMEPEAGISVGTQNFEDLEIKTNVSSSVEALETTAESGIGFEESRGLHIDTDISDVQASEIMGTEGIRDIPDPPVMETVIAPTVEFVDQIERSESMDFNLLLVNSTVVEVGTSNSLELQPKLERAGSIGSESLEKDRDVRETQESPVLDPSIAPAVEFVKQQERHSSIEFESECQIEPEGFGESETYPTDNSIASLQKSLVEANSLCDDESEDQSQRVGPPETQQSKTDEDCIGFQESPVVEASGLSTTVSEDRRNINSQIESVEVPNQTKSEVGVSEPVLSAGGHAVLSDIESQSNKKDSGEAIGSSTTESEDQRNINSWIETVDIQDQTKTEVVSERDVSGGINAVLSDTESQSNKKDSGGASGSSTMDSEDHMNIISQIETGEVQDQMDEIKPEVGVLERDVSDGVHVLRATESQSNKNESAAEGSEKSPAVKPYVQVDEERSHESHLEFSSSSSSSDED